MRPAWDVIVSKSSRRNESYSFCLIQGPCCHSLQSSPRGLPGKECFEIEDKTLVQTGCRVFVAGFQWREIQRSMPDVPHGKASHVHQIAECRTQMSGSLCPKALWCLNVNLVTQGNMCLLPPRRQLAVLSLPGAERLWVLQRGLYLVDQQLTLILCFNVSSLFSWTDAADVAQGLGGPGCLVGHCPWLM